MLLFLPAEEKSPKEGVLPRAFRVRLNIEAADGRVETRPVGRGAQTVAASLSSVTPMYRPRDKGKRNIDNKAGGVLPGVIQEAFRSGAGKLTG
jgi:hypothetical protein